MAALETLKTMTGGLPREVESLYFFSPYNDLLIYAPRRPDQLQFYRTAPAGFDFQQAEFSVLSAAANNPDARLRCTSLQTPIYDDSGDTWTTGCMTPVRIDGRHVGAWGISIPLNQMIADLRAPPQGASTLIVSDNGRLIHHSELSQGGDRALAANVELASSRIPMLRNIGRIIAGDGFGPEAYSPELDAYVIAERLDAPDWYLLTVLPQSQIRAQAWSIAKRVILVSAIGTLLLGLVLAALFHRTVAARLGRLAVRADSISASTGTMGPTDAGDEIRRLEQAFEGMERRLRQAQIEERRSFDTLVDSARHYAMILFDEDRSMLRASRGAIDLFGYDGVRALSDLVLAAHVPDGPTPGGELPGPHPRIYRRQLPNGTAIWLEELLLPLVDDDGRAFATAYIGYDLSDIQDKQRNLEESLLFLELAQSSARIGHFSLDPDAMSVSLSRWIRERFAIDRETVPFGEFAGLVVPGDRDRVNRLIREAGETGGELSFETTLTRPDGAAMDIQLRAMPVEADARGGQPLRYFGVVQDVTEQKEAASALVHAYEMVRSESQAKSSLLAVLSHEIRTPIAGILGLIDQIRRERSADERIKALRMVEDSSEALLKTLDATLQRTRLEQESGSDEAEEFRPAELVERVGELFRPLARRKGIGLDIECGPKTCVTGKPLRIQQILSNFLSNAVKYTSSGSISVRSAAPDAGDDMWTFSVRDTGCGISADRLARLFEPFAGSSPDSLGRDTGSGLGLSIVRKLAEDMAGSVQVESTDGKGTCMTLRLPLAIAAGDEGTARGTIAIDLSAASLAVMVEIAAAEQGYAAVPLAGNGEGDAARADVVVTDGDPARYAGRMQTVIALGESGGDPAAKGVVTIAESELLKRLPGLLREIADA